MEWYWILIIVIISLYVILAATLFCFPPWRKENPIIIDLDENKVLLGSHRAGSKERFESTIPAFRNSLGQAMNFIELDVHTTKDGKIVVFHDPTAYRMTGLDRTIEELNYDEIPPIMDRVKFPFGDGFYEKQEGIDEPRVPLLREIFELFPGVPMNIDLKRGSPEQAQEVYNMILEFKREDITYIGDTFEKENKIVNKIIKGTRVRSFASVQYTIRTVLLYFLGILQFFPFKYHSFWWPYIPPPVKWMKHENKKLS
mmetsp:Transcript_20194/g.19847  ORF Transcript_20194/g.19847 Transcript_20194/m.19847 type:complete len:256 (+) Transcript_20194:20-787(+)